MSEPGGSRDRGPKTDTDKEGLFAEYFRLMRTGDDAGAMRVLTAILAASPVGWWMLNP